jgi:zinc transport system substrate-binding protein
MKRKLYILLGIMALLIIIGSLIIVVATKKAEADISQGEDKLQVVTTFYPVYMLGLNLAEGIEEVEVKSLTDLNTGCLHDYQLTTEDMKIISAADVMVINGGGMESFLNDIRTNYPELKIIDASEGIEMLPSVSEHAHEAEEGDEEAEEEEQDHGEWNAHVWLDPKLYIKQIEHVSESLGDYIESTQGMDQSVADKINSNSLAYIDQIKMLDHQITDIASEIGSNTGTAREAVIFHDAFAYLANRIGITVAHTVPLDSDTSLSAGDIGEIIDEVQAGNIHYLFTEVQYSDSIASQIAAETDASVYIIDSAVTGDGSMDSYIQAMQKNIETLKELVK